MLYISLAIIATLIFILPGIEQGRKDNQERINRIKDKKYIEQWNKEHPEE